MAETPFPNPQTTEFNPIAWENNTPLTEDEITFLDENFVSYPTTQSNVTFPVSPTVPTLAIATSDTRAASAQFVQNAKNTQTWGALQTFSAGMVTNAINPLTDGGTLTIGNGAVNNVVSIMSASNTGTLTLGSSGSTTNLNTALTPAYTYGANGTTGSGKLGEIVTGTNVSPLTFTANVAKTVSTISSLAVGVWLFSAQVSRFPGTGYLNSCVSLTTDSFASPLFGDSYQTGTTGPLNSSSFILYVPTTGVPYYFVAQSDVGSPFLSVLFSAVRLF